MHWTKYLEPFGPCLKGLMFARRCSTIKEFWAKCEKDGDRHGYASWLWGAVAFQNEDFTRDLDFLNEPLKNLTWFVGMSDITSRGPKNWCLGWWIREPPKNHDRTAIKCFRAPTKAELREAYLRATKWERENG